MKRIYIYTLIFVLLTACNTYKVDGQEEMVDVKEVYMSKSAFAGSSSVTVRPNVLVTKVFNQTTEKTFSEMEWKELVGEVRTLDLAEMNKWKPSITEPYNDNAKYVEIMVVTNSGKYFSSPFKEGYPPKPLERLYKLINKYYNKGFLMFE